MGWFDDDEIFTAEVVTQKLWEDEATPIKTAVITAIKRDQDIQDYIMAAHYNSYGLFTRRFLNFGKDTERYPPGLPTSTISGLSISYDLIDPIIEAEVGEPVTLLAVKVGDPYITYWSFVMLQSSFGWSENQDLVQIGPNFYSYKSTHTDGGFDPETGQNLPVTTIYTVLADTGLGGEDVTLSQTYPGKAEGYYHVKYYLDSTDASWPVYWIYSIADHTYPTLDDPVVDLELDSDYYPIVPIRINGEFIDESEDDSLVEPVDKILKKLQLDYDDLKIAISGSDKDENGDWTDPDDKNEDLDKVDDAVFLFGLDIYTETEASIEYLWYFFHHIEQYSTTTRETFSDQIIPFMNDGILPETTFFKIEEGEFNTTVMFNFIEIKTGLNRADLDKPMKDKFEKRMTITDPYYHLENLGDDEHPNWHVAAYVESSSVQILRRTSETTYDEIRMHGPVHRTTVHALGQEAFVYRRLKKAFRDDNEDEDEYEIGKSGFFFPVSFAVLNDNLNLIEKEIVMYDAAIMCIYAADIQVIKWYQQGIFKLLMVIAMIVVTVVLTYFFGPAGLTMEIFWSIVFTAAISFVVGIALEKLVQLIPELAIAIAIITIALAIYRFDFTKFGDALFADKLIAGVQAINKGVSVYTSIKSTLLQMEASEFLKDAEVAMEELEDAKDMLEQDPLVYDPLYITESTSILNPSETSAEFYLRTLVTNPGVLGFDALHDYTKNALALPKIDSYDLIRPQTV